MKPECRQYQEWMAETFGEDLDPSRLPGLETHLTSCAECRADWEDYRVLRRGLDVLAEEDDGPSPFVEAKVLRAAAERHKARPSGFWRWILQPATVGFATLAVIAGLGYLGREELLRHRRPEDLTAPVERSPAIPAQPAPMDSPKEGGVSDKERPAAPAAEPSAPPATRGREADGKPKGQPEKPAPKLEERQLQQQAAPPPPAVSAPAEEKERAVSPPSGAAAGNQTSIPEAEFATPPSDREKAKKQAEEAAPAKSLQRAAPAPQPGGTASETSMDAVGSGLASKSASDPRFDKLLLDAKAKIKRKDYSGALEDLLAAQKIRDTKEIQDLILLCRSHLRGDG